MIHIFFGASGAATFRQFLKARGIAEVVAFLSENLEFGPISHGDLADREPWLDRHVPLDDGKRDWLMREEAKFRKRVENDPERLIWIAPASATEQAGLYWYLSQFGGTDLKLAIADFPFDGDWNGESPLNLSEVDLERMGQLYDECPRMAWEASRFPENRWSALVAENALLRVVNGGWLQSAPEDHFDQLLLARCPRRWVKWPRVIADTMGSIWKIGQSAGSDLLLWRLRRLIEDGRIACDGTLPASGLGASFNTKIRRLA